MAIENAGAFADDIITEIQERCKLAQTEMKASPDDAFMSGRALAYQEMLEIIQSRRKIYGLSEYDD